MMTRPARMTERFGLEPCPYAVQVLAPWWVLRERRQLHKDAQRIWLHRVNGGGLGRWDHVRTWRRDGYRYVTSEPYGFRQNPDGLRGILGRDLADFPDVVADVYDDAVWHEWTILVIVRAASAPAVAPGALYTVEGGQA